MYIDDKQQQYTPARSARWRNQQPPQPQTISEVQNKYPQTYGVPPIHFFPQKSYKKPQISAKLVEKDTQMKHNQERQKFMFLEGLEEGIRLGRMLGIQEILESLNKEIEKSIVPDKN